MSQTPPPADSLWSVPPADPNVHVADLPRLTGQNALVLDLLRAGDRLTPREAYEQHAITRLAARVYDLRRAGFDVKSDYDTKQKCAVYWLGKPAA